MSRAFSLRGVPEVDHAALTMCGCRRHMNLVMLICDKPVCFAVVPPDAARKLIDGLKDGLYEIAVEKDAGDETPQG